MDTTNRATLVSKVIAAFQDLHQSIASTTQEKQFETLLKSQTLLRAIYKAAVAGVQYTSQEHSTIGQYIARALQGIGAFVSHTTTYFPPHGSLGWSKIERSGLQFLLDDFGNINDSVDKAFKDFEGVEDIEGWDKRLQGASFFLSFNIHEFDLPDQELRMIPQHHFWLAAPFV